MDDMEDEDELKSQCDQLETGIPPSFEDQKEEKPPGIQIYFTGLIYSIR